MSVIVRMKVTKISTSEHYSFKEDGVTRNTQSEISLAVPHCTDPKDPNYAYSQLSGGTVFPLHTINDEAAAMFKLGETYDIVISPVQK